MTPEPSSVRVEPDVSDPRKIQPIFRDTEQIGKLGSWACPSGRVFWSDGIYPIFGLAHDPFDGTFEALLACIHPEDRQKVLQCREQVLREGQAFESEYRIIRQDGGVRFLLSRGRLFTDPTGNRYRVVGVSQDITERKELESSGGTIGVLSQIDKGSTFWFTLPLQGPAPAASAD